MNGWTKMMKKNNRIIVLAMLAALAACVKEIPTGHEPGKTIAFAASTGYENGMGTRTEYSGELVGSSPTFERINWVANTDRIRVLCEQVKNTTKTSDYAVTEATNTMGQRNSNATIRPASGDALCWGESTEMHYFYALYPAASMGGTAAVATITSAENNAAKVTGTIPDIQSVTWDSANREYKPDMHHAYMFAAAPVDPATHGEVHLPFKPLMTAFQFKLRSSAANSAGG